MRRGAVVAGALPAWVASVLFAVALCGCGGSDPEVVEVSPGGPKKDAGNRGPGDGDVGDGDVGDGDVGDGDVGDGDGDVGDGDDGPTGPGDEDALAPVIEILSPALARDPNEDDILTDTSVSARCRVTKSTEPDARDVDQSSVSIDLVDPAGEWDPINGTVNALTDNEFEAVFQLGELPNGPLSFVCAAQDVGSPSISAEATLRTFLDLGPSITILDPMDGGSYALKNPVVIRYEVKPAPVSDDDNEADVRGVELRVIDQVMQATEDPQQAGLYTLSVDFDDRTLFPMRPTTAEIEVRASSSRSPMAPERSESVDIQVDAAGPVINVTAPKDTAIVRGQVQLVMSITDTSGVRQDSVIGRINGSLFTLDDWTVMGNEYRAQFDTRAAVFDNLTQLTINITAEDNVGNASTAQHLLRLDNVPPVVSLDPPAVREYYMQNAMRICSAPFDPVGEDAVDDLDNVLASSLYRVLAFDRTNGSAGSNYNYFAGVANETVRLYAQKDRTIPLLVDTNQDGVCDEIQLESLPLADRPVVLELSPLTPRGTANFSSVLVPDDPRHTAAADCSPGASVVDPDTLCDDRVTSMTRALPAWYDSQPPAPGIFALNPTNQSTGACEGNSWELLGVIGAEGWVCLAARAEDNIGNVGVSRPLRVCLDNLSGPDPSCFDTASDPPPECTDGCTPPPELPANLMLLRR